MEPFKKALLERKEQITKNLDGTLHEIQLMRNQSPKDDADHASLSVGSDIDSAIIEQQRQELSEIELALDKIRNGSYGICEMCEDEISVERLEVKNFARYCITCREITENEHH